MDLYLQGICAHLLGDVTSTFGSEPASYSTVYNETEFDKRNELTYPLPRPGILTPLFRVKYGTFAGPDIVEFVLRERVRRCFLPVYILPYLLYSSAGANFSSD